MIGKPLSRRAMILLTVALLVAALLLLLGLQSLRPFRAQVVGWCGDGTCDKTSGENSWTCPGDCRYSSSPPGTSREGTMQR
jgi:hypothetical protein